MTLLELTWTYWQQIARPDLGLRHPELLPQIAAGLVGNGSECFGYDDEQSRDHDWGVDFFMWVDEPDRAIIPTLRAWKRDLFESRPPQFLRQQSIYGGTVGVMTAGDFYYSLLGMRSLPDDILRWRQPPEENFAMATNGSVFWDGPGTFSALRKEFLAYYPEDLRRKKIAARCMAIAQTGQYNLRRIAHRGDWVTVHITQTKFVQEVMGLVYHLNKVYRPYYKWTFRKLKELPLLGVEISDLLERLVSVEGQNDAALQIRSDIVDRVCMLLVQSLRDQGLSDSDDWFLAAHGEAVQRTIHDERLRSLPTQYE